MDVIFCSPQRCNSYFFSHCAAHDTRYDDKGVYIFWLTEPLADGINPNPVCDAQQYFRWHLLHL